MIALSLELTYALSPGWLKPWVEGVADGKAIARTCATCGRVSFAPLRQCACGGGTGTWTALPGTAALIQRTHGTDGDFGLVRFDGADTSTVVRLIDWHEGATVGHIVAPEGEVPALLLTSSQKR